LGEKVTDVEKKENEKEVIRLTKLLEDKNVEISELTQKLEAIKKQYEAQCSQLEEEVRDAKVDLRQKSHEYEHRLEELKNEAKELEASSDSKYQEWSMKKNQLQTVLNFQSSSLQVHLQMCQCQCYDCGAKHYNFVLNFQTSRNLNCLGNPLSKMLLKGERFMQKSVID
jgi:chromosome segregation ATPase